MMMIFIQFKHEVDFEWNFSKIIALFENHFQSETASESQYFILQSFLGNIMDIFKEAFLIACISGCAIMYCMKLK